MNYEYRKDSLDNDVLVLDSGDSYETKVSLEFNQVCLYIPDGYDSQAIDIPIEYWEEFKSFIDNQIAMKGN